MRASVSIPEKTLEHWTSQYVTYRFRSKAAMWWPARGEDIDIRWLPRRPGKVVQFELKTTTVDTHGNHDVRIDLGQLWDYLQRPLGRQPFYVFPRPRWSGTLETASRAKGLPVTELAYRRSGRGSWFGDWLVVLTAMQVADVLKDELAAHGRAKRGNKERLVKFEPLGPKREPNAVWGAERHSTRCRPLARFLAGARPMRAPGVATNDHGTLAAAPRA